MPRLLDLHANAQATESDPEYWGAVRAAVALGWLDIAVQLLDCHSAWILADSGAFPTALRRFLTLCSPAAGASSAVLVADVLLMAPAIIDP